MLNVIKKNQTSRSDTRTFDSSAAAACGAPLVITFKPNCAFTLLAGTLERRKAIKTKRAAVAELESLLITVVSMFHPQIAGSCWSPLVGGCAHVKLCN